MVAARRLAAMSLTVFLAAAAPAQTEVLRGQDLVVEAPSRFAGAAREILRLYPRLLADVSAALGMSPGGDARVLVVPDAEALAAEAARAGATPPVGHVAALAFPRERRILIRGDALRGVGPMTLASILHHEIAHLVIGAFEAGPSARPVPLWLHEGVAQALAENPLFPGRDTLSFAARSDRLFRFHDLAWAFPADPDRAALAYAQSLSFVRFLEETREAGPARGRRIPALLAALARGRLLDDAFVEATGLHFGTAEERWREHVRFSLAKFLLGRAGELLFAAFIVAAFIVAPIRAARRRRARLESFGPAEDGPTPDFESAGDDHRPPGP